MRPNRAQDSAKHGKPSRARLWQVLREQKHRFADLGLLADLADVDVGAAKAYLTALCNGKYVAKGENATNRRTHKRLYQLINDVGVDYPRLNKDGTPLLLGQANANMWRTMRMLRQFTTADVVGHASSSSVEITESAARAFIGRLLAAGYLTVTVSPKSLGVGKGTTMGVYLLSKDTGPKPPVWQAINCMYDQNLNEIMWHEEAGNE